MMKKIYVLDTSVLVHDPSALRSFRGAHVAIPIYVIMELDVLKVSTRAEVAASARMASRMVQGLSANGSLNRPQGAYDQELDTHFSIITEDSNASAARPIDVPAALRAFEAGASGRKMDGLILRSALALEESQESLKVVIVSKDVNLRLLSEFAGIEAQDYEKDRVSHDDLFLGFRHVEPNQVDLLHKVWIPTETLHPEALGVEELLPNEYLVGEDDTGTHLVRFDAETHSLQGVERDFTRRLGVTPRNLEQWIALDLLMNPDVHLITLVGRAGTGKTFLALAAALAQLSEFEGKGTYQRILLSKPVIAVGKELGYLPGDMEDKLQPWMKSFHDNLDELIRPDPDGARLKGASKNEASWEQLMATRQIEMQPLHTIRGRSINNAFMLIDEAQNLTPHEIKTIITRAAMGTKVILAGDPAQIDNPFLDAHSNGLVYVAERLKGSALTGSIRFSEGQRSPLAELGATLL